MNDEIKHLSESDFPELNKSNESGYCMTGSDLRVANEMRTKQNLPPLRNIYVNWEQNTAAPFFRTEGYDVVSRWFDGESDSFGPLSRCIRLRKDEQLYLFCYG